MIPLYVLLWEAKNKNSQSLEMLIEKFEPLINSLARKIKNEYGKTDLIIFFINFIYNLNIEKIKNQSDGALVNYIQVSFYREYYKLNNDQYYLQTELQDNIKDDNPYYVDMELKIFLQNLQKKHIVTKKQYLLILKKYYYQETNTEIALDFNVSRQAISKMHKSTIENIKRYLN